MAKITKMTKISHREVDENETDLNIDEFCRQLGLDVLRRGKNENIHFSTFNINRPGLQLADYYDHFVYKRVQVFGEQESAYLNGMEPDKRMRACDRLFGYDIPCVVITSALEPCAELMA